MTTSSLEYFLKRAMWVKICGIRDIETAGWVSECQPSAIGLNFYAPSPRSVNRDAAADICRTIPSTIEKVGVFVNHSLEDIVDTVTTCGLSAAQLHGDEPAEFLKEIQEALPTIKLIRAFRINIADDAAVADSWHAVGKYLDRCSQIGVNLFASLVDAFVPGTYGGTGRTIFSGPIMDGYRRNDWPKLILAGGLTPENVTSAIEKVHPWGVDVASGVESSAGVKDRQLVSTFIERAKVHDET